MESPARRNPRRTDALSRERIVAAGIELLDDRGFEALTVRALTDHLATGRGAIYHHVSGRDDLLAMAAEDVLGRAISGLPAEAEPNQAVRAFALAVFEAIEAHPWLGVQLARQPRQPAVFRIWTHLGGLLRDLGVDEPLRSNAGSALVNHILGAAAQSGAAPHVEDREAFLEDLAAAWAAQDPDPLVQEAAARLKDHDDRAQFLAGVDILLAGTAALG